MVNQPTPSKPLRHRNPERVKIKISSYKDCNLSKGHRKHLIDNLKIPLVFTL